MSTGSGFEISQAFARDEDKSVNGARIEMAPGVAIWVARMNNPKYATAILSFYRENQFQIQRNLIEGNAADEQVCKILAETIFVRMEGLLHEGEPLKDTPERRCWALMTFPELREKVVEESQNFANYRAAGVEAEGKDSSNGSGGKRRTGERKSKGDS